MRYEYTPYREFVSDDDLILDLVQVAKHTHGSPLTQKVYNEFGRYTSERMVYRFGTWNKALEKAGLQPSANRQFSDKELFDNLAHAWQFKGKQPVRRDMNNVALSSISSGAYIRRFGTWTNALRSFVDYMEDDNEIESVTPTIDSDHSVAKAKKRDVNDRLRWRVMRRDNFRCCLCGASPAKDPSVELHIDHIIPWSKGGETTMENLRVLCSKCNLGKGDQIE